MIVINVLVDGVIKPHSIYYTNSKVVQSITTGLKIPTGNYNDVLLNFTFISPKPKEGSYLFAVFKSPTSKKIEMEIGKFEYEGEEFENACFVPHEVLNLEGKVELGVYTYKMNDEELEKRVSLVPIEFTVIKGSYDEEAGESVSPTPTVFEEYFNKIAKATEELEDNLKNTMITYEKYETVYTATEDDTKIIPIGIAEYSEEGMLFVKINGLDLIETVEYTVSENKITLVEGVNADTPVHIVYLKPMKEDVKNLGSTIEQLMGDYKKIPFNSSSSHIEDTGELPMPISINGGIEQETREGYSLIDFGNPTTQSNSTSTFENDIFITTSTGSSYYNGTIFDITELYKNNSRKKIKFVFESIDVSKAGSVDTFIQIRIAKNDGTTEYKTLVTNSGNTSNLHEISEDVSDISSVALRILSNNSTNVGNYSISIRKPMLVFEENVDKPYEQYGATPSIDFPSEVKGVSGHYDNVIGNKNIWKPTLTNDGFKIIQSKCTVELNEDEYTFVATDADMFLGDVAQKGLAYAKSKGILHNVKGKSTVYLFLTNKTLSKNLITAYDKNKISLGFSGIISSGGKYNLPEGTEYISLRIGYGSAVVGETYKTKIMLAFEEITEYVPPQEQNYALDIPFNMYSGKPYKENGKWYRDVEWGMFKFTESVIIRDTDYGFAYTIAKWHITDKGFSVPTNSTNYYSNRYKFVDNSNDNQNNASTIRVGGTYVIINYNGAVDNVEEFRNSLVNDTYFILPLETPYKEEITDKTLIKQLEDLQKAYSYKEVTNINSYKASEDVADLVLSGNALMSNDIRLSKIENVILSLGGNV